MDELEDMLMEHGIMKAVDESLVGKTAAELAAAAAKRSTGRPASAEQDRAPRPRIRDFMKDGTHEPGAS